MGYTFDTERNFKIKDGGKVSIAFVWKLALIAKKN